MKTTTRLMTISLVSFFAMSAQALNLKSFVAPASEVARMLKTGAAAADRVVEAEFYPSQPSKHVVVGSYLRESGETVYVLVSRIKGVGMDLLKIHLVTPVDASVKGDLAVVKEIDETMKAVLAKTELKKEGLAVMSRLVDSKLVVLSNTELRDIMDRLQDIHSLGTDVSPLSGEVLMDKTLSTPQKESLDLALIKNLADMGPAAAFEIRLSISENTPVETLSRVLSTLAEGPSGAMTF